MATAPRGQKGSHKDALTLDEVSKAMLYNGLNTSQLATAFRMDNRTVAEKLFGVEPDGMRNNTPIWKISTAAPYLARLTQDEVEKQMKRMHHNDLPKLLTKEYWAGQRSRQEYELKNGDLWPTTKVVEYVGDFVKLVKMSTLLMVDAVERTTELTERQRKLIKGLSDGMLNDLNRSVLETFSRKDQLVIEESQEQHNDQDEEL